MLQNLQNIAKFQNFQLDNLVDFEKFTGASRKRVAPPNTKHRSGASVIAYV